jgi:MFS family permease
LDLTRARMGIPELRGPAVGSLEPIAHGAQEGAPPWRAAGVGYRLATGVFGANLPSTAVINVFPFLAGAMIDTRHVSPAHVGFVMSVELLAMAVVAIGLGALPVQVRPRLVGIIGCCAFAVGNLLSMQAGPVMLLGARALAGMGGGLAITAGGRAVAQSSTPARLSSYVAVALSILGVGMAVIAGAAVRFDGYSGGCLLLACIGIAGAVCAIALPAHSRIGDGAGLARAGPDVRKTMTGDWIAATALLAAACCTFAGMGGVWTFSERIGLATGLSTTAVANAIGFTSLASAAGGAAAAVVARLHRDFLSAGVGALICGFSAAALALASTPVSYVLALAVLSFAFIFVGPFLVSIAVQVDPTGGLAGAQQGGQMLAAAIAPFAGGLILASGSFRTLAFCAAVAAILAVMCILTVFRRVNDPCL